MKIEASAKEIADLVLALQSRQWEPNDAPGIQISRDDCLRAICDTNREVQSR